MKICWDSLENFNLGRRNKELRKGNYTYIEKDACKSCGEPYLMNTNKPSEYCCISCGKYGSNYYHNEETRKKIGKASIGNKYRFGKTHSLETKKKLSKITSSKVGCKASSWKGGVIQKNIPLYDTYAKQIEWVDSVKPIEKDGMKLMMVKCTQCGKWYIPKTTNVWDRLKYLKGQITCENRFYCSSKCKKLCNIYGQSLWPKNKKPRKNVKYIYFSRQELVVWREEVLNRANYECEYCGEYANIAHHIKPKKLEPFFALDPDYGIACCKKCHNKYCHVDECSTWSLSRVKCK